MNTFASTALISACMALSAGAALAQTTMPKDSTGKDPMMKGDMTMAQCKEHMAMAKTDAKKDAAMKKMDAQCADMMKKDKGAMKDGPGDGAKK